MPSHETFTDVNNTEGVLLNHAHNRAGSFFVYLITDLHLSLFDFAPLRQKRYDHLKIQVVGLDTNFNLLEAASSKFFRIPSRPVLSFRIHFKHHFVLH